MCRDDTPGVQQRRGVDEYWAVLLRKCHSTMPEQLRHTRDADLPERQLRILLDGGYLLRKQQLHEQLRHPRGATLQRNDLGRLPGSRHLLRQQQLYEQLRRAGDSDLQRDQLERLPGP
jgi:hypothetical protein